MTPTTSTQTLCFAIALVFATACQSSTEVDTDEQLASESSERGASERGADEQGAPSPENECGAVDELNSLDERRPVPLQPMMAWHQKQNMMEHLVAIQRITGGLSDENWEEVEQAALLIGTSPQMEHMCQHMGAGAAGFTDLALDFHRRADAIAVAARTHDTPAVLRATNLTLQACTTCHATFRQDVVDAETWQERTN
ncbi:MAG: hypothetical protein AB8H86_27440 [Polyangiales bacterium]